MHAYAVIACVAGIQMTVASGTGRASDAVERDQQTVNPY
jgi:hypothetical protein